MAIPALQTILDRIDTWPVERQERLAEIAGVLDAEDDNLTISASRTWPRSSGE